MPSGTLFLPYVCEGHNNAVGAWVEGKVRFNYGADAQCRDGKNIVYSSAILDDAVPC